MFKIYVYIFDTLADWELGYVTAELNSGRFFKKDAPRVSVKTVGISKESVKTMGGMTIVPDCVIDDIAVNDKRQRVHYRRNKRAGHYRRIQVHGFCQQRQRAGTAADRRLARKAFGAPAG